MATYKTYLYGKIDGEGRLSFDDQAAFAHVRGSLRGRAVQVLIEPKRKPRSVDQNEYYWGVVLKEISNKSGHTPDEAHDAMREKFLSKYDDKTGLMIMRSTTSLSSAEFEKYMRDIRMWASEMGWFIALPNEQLY